MRVLCTLTCAYEAVPTQVYRRVECLGRRRAGVDNPLMPEFDHMLSRPVHAAFVVDGLGGVETERVGRVDADDRHLRTAQLLDLRRLYRERCHEHGVHVAKHRQHGEEPVARLSVVDVLVERDVIAFAMHHIVYAGEHLGIEPARDALAHEQRYAVCLPGFERHRRA